jgi:hypothetical protein
MSRAELWRGTDIPIHLSLVDDALDQNDVAHQQLRAALDGRMDKLAALMEDGFQKCEDDAKRQSKLLTTILVAIVVASVTMVINIIVFGAPT